MARGPLDNPRLRDIERCLDSGNLDEAQRLLIELGDVIAFRPGTAFLMTRLQLQRGRLPSAALAQRMRDILNEVGHFPEAAALLAAAEQGKLSDPSTPGRGKTAPMVEGGPGPEPSSPIANRKSVTTLPNIPRAPLVPSFTPPPDVRPSYAPDHVPAPGRLTVEEPGPPTAREPLASRDSPQPRDQPDPGRYAHRPSASIEVVRARPSPRPPADAPPATRRDRPRVRSGRPPADAEDASMAAIATLLDEGRFDRALELVERGDAEHVERAILHARSLAAAGRHDQARALAVRLVSGTLEPEARAAAARVLLELGDPERALLEAERAQREQSSALVELTVAWALVRLAWRRNDPSLFVRAELLLRVFKGRDSPLPAVVQALRACIQAMTGDPERAIGAAQRALALDAHSPDALIALSAASAKLGRSHDARSTWLELKKQDAAQAEELAACLGRLGFELASE